MRTFGAQAAFCLLLCMFLEFGARAPALGPAFAPAFADDAKPNCSPGFRVLGQRSAWSEFTENTQKHWQNRLRFLSAAEDMKLSDRVRSGASFVLSNGIKAAFPPAILVTDLPAATRAAFRTGPSRLVLVPLDVAQRAAPALAGYAALVATGSTLPIALSNRSVTLDDLDHARPPGIDIGPDELVVYVSSKNDPPSRDLAAEMQSSLEKSAATAKDFRIQGKFVSVEVISREDLFEKLGRLRKYGRIKDIHWVTHAVEPGRMKLEGASPSDLLFPGSTSSKPDVITGDHLKKLQPLVAAWPSDLFAENSRMTLYGCSLAKGKKGDEFVAQLGALTLQHGGKIFASTRPVFSGTAEELKKEQNAFLNLGFAANVLALEKFGMTAVLDSLKSGPAEPKIKVFEY